jgi:hypothetical protein
MTRRGSISTFAFFRRTIMRTPTKLARLKGQLAAHRHALDALNTATRELHKTLNRIVGAVGERTPTSATKRASKEPRPKRSGGAASAPPENGMPGGRRTVPAKSRNASDRALASALERHWGNLF